MTEQEYWYWLTNIKNMWQGKIELLLRYFEEPQNIYRASVEKISCIQGLKKEDIANIIESRNKSGYGEELNQLDKKGIKFIYIGSKDYPEKLMNIYSKPYSFYIKGGLPIGNVITVAIIGARNCSLYGKKVAEEIASSLAQTGVQIISGMARGIDAAGQWGAIKGGGKCFSVLGCGVDICYPSENIELYEKTIQSGGIISEYPPGTKANAWHFPQRNRIISGLADKIIVVEAKEKSGTCITVECALEQGKDVYAVPGRINDPLSEGCNKLIKQGASLFTCIQDIIGDDFGMYKEGYNFNAKNNYPLAKDLEVLYANLNLFPKSLNNIIEETGLDPKEVIKGLTRLELMDLVCEPIKNYYSQKG